LIYSAYCSQVYNEPAKSYLPEKLMDVIVSAFAVIVALGCFIAIYLASRKDKQKEEQD